MTSRADLEPADRVVGLIYHDVVPLAERTTTGFPGVGTDHYKLEPNQFAAHLAALQEAGLCPATLGIPAAVADSEPAATRGRSDALARPPLRDVRPRPEQHGSGIVAAGAPDQTGGRASVSLPPLAVPVAESAAGGSPALPTLLLTFDDGGRAAAQWTAPALEARGWRGHFFITTSRIGTPGFLDAEQIRALRAAGHVVGSHSHTHRFMTALSDTDIRDEWSTSRAILEETLAEEVRIASVPTGFFNRRVAELAAETGYRALLTSEPWLRPRRVGDLLVYGRFSVTDRTPPARVAALARGAPLAVAREAATWHARKAAKRLLGPVWFPLRRALLGRPGG